MIITGKSGGDFLSVLPVFLCLYAQNGVVSILQLKPFVWNVKIKTDKAGFSCAVEAYWNDGGLNMKNCRGFLVFATLCIFSLLPVTVLAADTEYDLNKKKTVTITDRASYDASGKYTWLKYQPKSDGYLTLRISNPSGALENAKGYLALYNSTKGSLLSSKTIFYNMANSKNAYWRKFTFGLRKGQVYYIRVKSDNAVKLAREFKKVKDKSGSLKTNAYSLKKNKTSVGLIPAGSVNADWYKINLTKKQKINLYYNAKISGTGGSFRISVYADKRLIGVRNIYYTSSQRRITLCQYNKTTRKTTSLNTGVYYLKIERANLTSSGYYKIKWK